LYLSKSNTNFTRKSASLLSRHCLFKGVFAARFNEFFLNLEMLVLGNDDLSEGQETVSTRLRSTSMIMQWSTRRKTSRTGCCSWPRFVQ